MSTPTSFPFDTRLTVDDYMRFPDDGKRHEIIDGEHYVTPSPNMRHQAISGRLHLALGNFLTAHPELGLVFYAPFDVIFSHYDVVEPDLLVIAGDQLSILTAKNIQGAPAIVIEILSRGTRRVDEVKKRQLFERGGVREYWLLDPDHDRIRILRRGADGAFTEFELAKESAAILETPILPGFGAALSAIFAPL